MENSIPPSAGIYKITCIPTKKIYIGSAVNLRRRRKEHFSDLRCNQHVNSYMQRAWNKYGEGAFVFEVWELVLPMSLSAREQYWLNKLKPFGRKGFNIARDTISPTFGRKRSPETREKLRRANSGYKHTPEAKERMKLAHLGVKLSSEHIEKRRQGQIGHETSPETRKKIGQANLGRKHTPEARAKMKDRRFSLEHREKLRQARRARVQTE